MTTDQPAPNQPKRSWYQFSLKALLGLVAFVAIACTALLNASDAVLRSIYRHSATRAFWLGFAFVGWVYLMFTPAMVNVGDLWLGWSSISLVTTTLSELAYSKLPSRVETFAPGNEAFSDEEQYHFVTVAHCLWTWLFALLGGLLARYLYATREREP